MHLSKRFLAWALCFFLLFAAAGVSKADVFVTITEKKKEKEKNHWSLAEWIDQRDRMRMMDLWLALHTPTPYEFYLSGQYKTGGLDNGGYYGGWDFSFAAFAYLFGLELQRQWPNIEGRWVGLVDFRLWGYHSQSSNLTLQGGLQNETRSGTSLWNPLMGVSLNFYIAKNFGIEGLYRHAFGMSGGIGSSADHFEAGAFIDFNFVRVYGDYFAEVEAGNPAESFTGAQVGTRLYF